MTGWRRWMAIGALAIVVGLAGLVAFALTEARRDPLVRRATIALPHWPAGASPVRVVLLSDIHIGTRAMDAARLARIVELVNGLRPDLVVIAGDFIFGHDPRGAEQLGGPLVPALAALRAPLGTVAVLGNHDHWTGPTTVRALLARAHVRVLENEAVRLGPLAVGGIGDAYTGHDRVATTAAAMRRLSGAPLLVTHAPRLAVLLPADLPLLLAGHTHCGQVVLPLLGYVDPVTRLERPFFCGATATPEARPRRLVVVTAGLGTSGLPLRFGAPPDLWLLTLGPTIAASGAAARP